MCRNKCQTLIFLFLILLVLVAVGSVFADSSEPGEATNEKNKSYGLIFNHSGSDTYSFVLKTADGKDSIPEAGVEIQTSGEEQGVCRALVIVFNSEQTNKTYSYQLSSNLYFTNESISDSKIIYSIRAERGGAPLSDLKPATSALDMELTIVPGYQQKELCTLFIDINDEDLASAAGGRYSDTLTFTLTVE